MKHKGSCHGGNVSFEVDGEIGGALDCNRSLCQRKGSLRWFVLRSGLKRLPPESAAATCTFNRHLITQHHDGRSA